jgi:hypothetical protein
MKLKFLILSILILLTSQSYGQEKVYYNQTEFGILFGNNVETWNGEREKRRDFSMVTFHGVKISRHHVVGMSVGFD